MRFSIVALGLLPFLIAFAGDEDDQKKYKKSADTITLPNKADIQPILTQHPEYKYIVDWVYTKDNWVKVFKQVHQRIGLAYDDGVPTTLRFTNLPNESPALVDAHAGPATMAINLPTFHSEVKSFPSIGVAGLITHEFTHAIQFNKGGMVTNRWPMWLIEGMATYTAAPEEKYILVWAQKEPPHSLDDPMKDVVDAPYAWGHLYLTYLEEKFGKDKMFEYVDQIINQKKDYRKAAEEISKKSWKDLMTEELPWRVNWVKSRLKKKK